MKQLKNPIATIVMKNGKKIIIELMPQEAPNTVASFISLSNRGLFDNFAIERIVPGFVVDISYTAFGKEECKYLIKNESSSKGFLNHIKVEPGVIAMGGYDTGIAGGEFFFPLAYHERLDGNYPAFGRVIEGYEEIKRWESVKLIPVPFPLSPEIEINRPEEPILIEQIRVETFGVQYKEPVKLNMKTLPSNW